MREHLRNCVTLQAESLTHEIIGAAIDVHRELGPGLLESAYEECLLFELNLRGLKCRQQIEVPVRYKGLLIDCKYKLDLIVEEQVIVEVKSVNGLVPVFEAQLMTYMKLTGVKLGLLLNFNVVVLKNGMKRIIL